MGYIPIIGLEIHCELKTNSKMFCSCKNGLGLEKEPNINICPTCTGQPGTLPYPNKKALESVIKAGLALNCDIAKISKFDRKNYFYPDLPKGYQISQYDQPLCQNGYILLDENKKIKITRIHIEEDTGKLNHELNCTHSLVDLNRAGVPLMELVSEPDIRSAEDAKIFCKELQKILRYIEISDADMEKGQMRCEANISILPENEDQIMENFGTKVEIKNLNSFKAVEKGILFEIERQTKLLDSGKQVIQETRGWNDSKQITFPQRIKEGAADYRYFPEPDIPPMNINHDSEDDKFLSVKKIVKAIPELPIEKKNRFQNEYQLEPNESTLLTENKLLAEFSEQMFSELQEWYKSYPDKSQEDWNSEQKKLNKMATGWIVSKLFKLMNDNKTKINDVKITPENFAELITLLYRGKINSSAGQLVLEEMFKTGSDPEHVILEKNLEQVDDKGALEEIIDNVIQNFPDQVTQYKNGKTTIIQFLMGQVMKESKGKANPKSVMELLEKKLN